MRHSNKPVVLNPYWFKLRIESRKQCDRGVPLEVDYAYVSGHSVEQVKEDYSKSLGLGYFVKVKPIAYDDIIKELDRAC